MVGGIEEAVAKGEQLLRESEAAVRNSREMRNEMH
jgi:hypothetical protein